MTRSTLLQQAAWTTLGTCLLAAGGWFVALRGAHRQMEEARRTLLRQESVLSTASVPPADAVARTEEYERRAALLRGLIAETPTAEQLYERIQTAATAAGVRIDRIEPLPAGRRVLDLTKQTGLAVEPLAVELRAKGTFASVASFTDQIERWTGLCKITTVRITPAEEATPSSPVVILQLACTHFALAESPKAALPAASKEKR